MTRQSRDLIERSVQLSEESEGLRRDLERF